MDSPDPAPRGVRRQLDASMLRVSALTLLGLTGAILLVTLLLGLRADASLAMRGMRLATGVVIMAIAGASLLLLRLGQVKAACFLLLGGLFALPIFTAVLTGNGVAAAGMPLLGCFILMSGFVLEPRAGMIAALLAALAVLLLYGAEQVHWISGVAAGHVPPSGAIGVVLLICFLVTGWLTLYYARIFDVALAGESAARQALAASEMQLRAILETEPECVKLLAPDLTVLRMNAAGLAMVEADRAEQVIGRPVLGLVADEHRAAFAELNRQVMQGVRGELEYEVVGFKGTRRWLETHAVPMREQDGRISGVLAITRDISARREIEVERSRHEQVLRTLTDVLPGVVGYWDEGLRCRFANAGFRHWLGIAPGMALGMRMQDVFDQHTWAQIADAVQGARGGTAGRLQVESGRLDGSRGIGMLFLIPDPESAHGGFYSIGWDITELRAAQAALETANHELARRTAAAEAATEAKSQFLATVSHEIRTPLNGILGMAQLMLDTGTPPGEQQRLARTILNAGSTLLAILNDILDLSKVEAGKLEIISGVFNPAQLVSEVDSLMRDGARQKQLELVARWTGDPATAYLGDPVRIRQMLTNLVSNAIKFTLRGRVEIEGGPVGTAGESLRFSVRDTGIGVASDQLGRLFQPFSQIDASYTRQFGGTGLGLSIVRALAERMGGTVGVESAPGEGSCFWFELPLPPAAARTEQRSAPRDPAPAPIVFGSVEAATRRKPRVLQVEDHQINRFVVESLLRKRDIEVTNAENGQQAVEMLCGDAARPDLVLMDLQMPIMDGLEATRRIRAHEQAHGLPRLPILALTANAFAQDRANCSEAGMDDFLVKPVNAEQLFASVQQWLERSPGAGA